MLPSEWKTQLRHSRSRGFLLMAIQLIQADPERDFFFPIDDIMLLIADFFMFSGLKKEKADAKTSKAEARF